MVENAVKNGKKTKGNMPGTWKYKSGKIWVVGQQGRARGVGRP